MTTGIPVQNQDISDFDGRPEVERANAAAVAAGDVVEEKRIVDYFAAPETHRYNLPDGVQYFDYQELREGGKALYERATNREGIRVQRATGDAKLSVDPATARQTMVKLSVVDACIYAPDAGGRMERIPFNKEKPGRFWERVFESFPAKLIESLHEDIQKVNTWIAADDDITALEEQREQLEERISRAKDEQAKKISS